MQQQKTGKKKRIWIFVAVAVLVLGGAASAWYFLWGPAAEAGAKVYVMSVGEITGNDLTGVNNRFSGIVESQETQDLQIESGRVLDEILVEIGDTVEVGDELFSYTTDDISRKMQQTSLEIEGSRNEISRNREQITELEAEKAGMPPEEQLDYTLQIQSLLASISQTEYTIKTKQVEYDQLKKSFDNSVVKASLAGTVQSINEQNATDPNTGSQLPFMVIMKGGDFLVKGTVSELNLYALSPGMRVIIRSRVNEEELWGGSILNLDTSQTADDSQNGGVYYGGMESGNSASKYSFFVDPDSILGLMIGQHVTIELDLGQGSVSSGLWLSGYYIDGMDSVPFVWADNGRDRLEKREITLGQYNAELDSYEITTGLSKDDYIAFPDPSFAAGMATTRELEIPAEDPGMTDPGMADPGMDMDMGVAAEPAPVIGGMRK